MRYLIIGICIAFFLSCSNEGETTTNEVDTTDTDGDGWTDSYEEMIGTNPYGADLDSDSDGIPDALERRLGTNEHSNDSNGDGKTDDKEDPDEDGLPTWFELQIGSDPGDKGDDNDFPDGWEDQDGDGLIDFLEFGFGTDPFKKDTDGDGLDDNEESQDYDLDGTNPDSDGDGIIDGEDPAITPEGCTDTDSKVTHAYNTCINGKYHTLTVRYYIRRCQGEADQVFYIIIDDVPTSEPCDEAVKQPPPLSEIQ